MKKNFHIIFLLFFLLAQGVSTSGAQSPNQNFNSVAAEELKSELEALKEVMAQLKSEMTVIMAELAKGMKETQKEMRRELESLRGKSQGVLSQVMEVIKKEQLEINEENQALRKELKKFKILAESITYQFDKALDSTNLDTKKFLDAMQAAINESRRQAAQHKVASVKVLDISRETAQVNQKYQKRMIDQSRIEVLSSLNATIQTLENDRGQNRRDTKQVQRNALAAREDVENLKKNSATTKKERLVKRFRFKSIRKKVRPQTQLTKLSKKSATETAKKELPRTLTKTKTTQHVQSVADPLLIHKKKLAGFSDEVKKLKRELASGEKNTRLILIEVGKINLQSQRYLDALSSKVKLQLIQYADTAKIILGNFEMVVWTLKSALRLNPEDGDTHFLLAGVFEEMREGAEAIRHARMAEHWFQKRNQRKKAIEAKTLGQSIQKKIPGKPQPIARTAAR